MHPINRKYNKNLNYLTKVTVEEYKIPSREVYCKYSKI